MIRSLCSVVQLAFSKMKVKPRRVWQKIPFFVYVLASFSWRSLRWRLTLWRLWQKLPLLLPFVVLSCVVFTLFSWRSPRWRLTLAWTKRKLCTPEQPPFPRRSVRSFMDSFVTWQILACWCIVCGQTVLGFIVVVWSWQYENLFRDTWIMTTILGYITFRDDRSVIVLLGV